MKNLKKYLKYAFEILDESGKQIDKIDGPGEIGYWLKNPELSPDYIAILPATYETAISKREKNLLYKTVRIPLDDNWNELEGGKEEMVLFDAKNEQEAKALATELGCKYMYWSEWDGTRVMLIVDVENKEKWNKVEYETYYYEEI